MKLVTSHNYNDCRVINRHKSWKKIMSTYQPGATYQPGLTLFPADFSSGFFTPTPPLISLAQDTCLHPQLPRVTYRGVVALEDIVAPWIFFERRWRMIPGTPKERWETIFVNGFLGETLIFHVMNLESSIWKWMWKRFPGKGVPNRMVGPGLLVVCWIRKIKWLWLYDHASSFKHFPNNVWPKTWKVFM